MREISQDIEIQNKKLRSSIVTTDMNRTSANNSSKNNLQAPACVRKRDKSESDMDIFTSGMLSNIAGHKRELGHRCVALEY